MTGKEMFLIFRGPSEDRFRVTYRSKVPDGQAECVWEEGKRGERAHMGQFVYGSQEEYEAATRKIDEFTGQLKPGAVPRITDLYRALRGMSIQADAV